MHVKPASPLVEATRDSMMNLDLPIRPSAQSRRGRPSGDSPVGFHAAGAGSCDFARSKSPNGREQCERKDKELKGSDGRIRKMRPKHNASSPAQKLNVDGARPSALRSPPVTDASDSP